MRLLVLFLLTLGAGALSAQTLDTAAAPPEFQGYTFGAAEQATVEALTQTGTTFRQDAYRPALGLTRITIPHQHLDKLNEVTFELFFAKGVLYQVGATLAYSADAHQALLSVLTAKYGAVRSQDGGYHHSWFFNQAGRESANHLPDFAIVLANDPVTAKTIGLTYVDNLKRNPAPAAAPPASAPAAPPAAPDLNPSHF